MSGGSVLETCPQTPRPTPDTWVLSRNEVRSHSERARVALLVGNTMCHCVHGPEETRASQSKEFRNAFSPLEPRKGNGNPNLLSVSLPQFLGETKHGPTLPDSCG